MMQKMYVFLVLCFLIALPQVGKAACGFAGFHHGTDFINDLDIATGHIIGLGKNSIDIFSEEDNKVLHLFYAYPTPVLHQGEYVRIFYHPDNSMVQAVKPMAIISYNKQGQNLGYLVGGNAEK